MKTLILATLLFVSVAALAQDETPMAAPVSPPDATQTIAHLQKQIALRDAVIAEKNAQLAAFNAILYRVMAESDNDLLKDFARYLIALIENRGKKP